MPVQSGLPDTPMFQMLGSKPSAFLCAPVAYAPASQTPLAISSTVMTAWAPGTVCTGNFAAPDSGAVVVTVSVAAQVSSGANKIVFGLAAAGTVTPMAGAVSTFLLGAGSTLSMLAPRFTVASLTAGSIYNFDLLGATSAGTATVFAYGNTAPTVGSAGAPVLVTVEAV